MASGKIQTVLGLIEPSRLGITLTHEHLSMNHDVAYFAPQSPKDKGKESLPLIMNNLGWIRQNCWSHKENLKLTEEEEAVIEEIKQFKANGGCSLVENSTNGLDRNIEFVQSVAKETGVNIIAGTGYYIDVGHPADMGTRSEESLCQEMIHDIIEGVGQTGIKCGAIGEIGCSWPLTANERKVLRSSAHAQTALGCPVIIHPGRNPKAPEDIIRILAEAGGDISKTVMSHLDRTLDTDDSLLEFANLGSYCEYDLFGMEVSHYGPTLAIDMPSDAERIRRIKVLIDNGFLDNIMIAHDNHTKHRLVKYGGHGYSHILNNVVPKMLDRGISQDSVDTILIENPRKWLTFK